MYRLLILADDGKQRKMLTIGGNASLSKKICLILLVMTGPLSGCIQKTKGLLWRFLKALWLSMKQNGR